MSLRTRFRKWHDIHANPHTPVIHTLLRVDNKIIEISESRREDYWGVSVWEDTGNTCKFCDDDRKEHNRFESVSHDLSQPFRDKKEALDYAQLLKQKLDSYEEIKDVVEDVEE